MNVNGLVDIIGAVDVAGAMSFDCPGPLCIFGLGASLSYGMTFSFVVQESQAKRGPITERQAGPPAAIRQWHAVQHGRLALALGLAGCFRPEGAATASAVRDGSLVGPAASSRTGLGTLPKNCPIGAERRPPARWAVGPAGVVFDQGIPARMDEVKFARRAVIEERGHAAISRKPEGNKTLLAPWRAAVVTAEAGSSARG